MEQTESNTAESNTAESNLAELAGAKTPADRGLSGLGLLMQLSGSVFLALGAYIAMLPLLLGPTGSGDGKMEIFFIGVFSVVRSIFHRSAGMAILYGTAKGYMHHIKLYFGMALFQSFAVASFLMANDAPGKVALFIVAVLMVWPATLLFALTRPRFARLGDKVPKAEDLGFESAAVLMTIFGVAGCVLTGLVLINVFRNSAFYFQEVPGLLWTGVIGMLFVRSALHLKAGWQGTSGVHAEQATASASNYFNFGVISAILAGAVLMLQMLMSEYSTRFDDFFGTAIMTYLLFIWPTALRNFFTDRNFSMLLDEQTVTRRVPDTGLTALGWLLLANGGLGLVMSLGTELLMSGSGGTSDFMMLGNLLGGDFHSNWWNIGVSGLQVYAGIELVRMSDSHRVVATFCGAVTALVNCYLWWPQLESFNEIFGASPMMILTGSGGIVLSMALAIATVVLVNRSHDPDAKARITA
jgi:hypothetical protein